MPLPDDVRKGMDSDVADISQVNAGMDRAGHMLQGGVFLREFVADGRAVGAHRHRRAVATTPASRPATGPRAAPACRSAPCSTLVDRIAAE